MLYEEYLLIIVIRRRKFSSLKDLIEIKDAIDKYLRWILNNVTYSSLENFHFCDSVQVFDQLSPLFAIVF